MKIKNFIRTITPDFLLNLNRKRKKKSRNSELEKLKNIGSSLTTEQLLKDIQNAGIHSGDVVLVHSSLSKIGHLEKGAETLIDSLMKAIGENGTLLMPTSPNAEFQFDFIQKKPVFDVLNTPSKTGIVTETFRKMNGVIRSLHPTEPVAAFGKLADELTKDHFNQITPYNSKSPFYKLTQYNGKILYIGVTLDNAGTNLHTLEDEVDFKFPVYADEVFNVEVIDYFGNSHIVQTKVHNPIFSKKRKCDELLPMFLDKKVAVKVKIGQADALLFDAKKMFEVMVDAYKTKGVTMYTPKGS